MKKIGSRLTVIMLSVMLVVTMMVPSVSFAADGSETEGIQEATAAPAQVLEDGTYSAVATTDSGMFKFSKCTLYVQDGIMSAVLSLSGSGFNRLYLGSAKKAASANADDLLYYADEDGHFTFWPVPVRALDEEIQVAAHAYRDGRDTWYDHKVTIKSAGLSKVSDGIQRPSKKLEAAKYIQQHYVAEGIFADEGDATLSGDGYLVSAYNDKGEKVEALKLKQPENGIFKSGWTFSDETLFGGAKSSGSSFSLEELKEDTKVEATLSLYKPTEKDEAIDAGTAEPLASQAFTLYLSASPAESAASIQAVDVRTGEVVTEGVEIKVTWKISRKKTGEVKPDQDGKYKLTPGTKYTVKATTTAASGYYTGNQVEGRSYTGSFVPKTVSETYEIPVVPEKDCKDLMTVKIIDEETGEPVPQAELKVSVGKINDIQPEDGKYSVWHGVYTNCSVTADGYLAQTARVIPDQRDYEAVVAIRKPRTYRVKPLCEVPLGYPEMKNKTVQAFFDGNADSPMEAEEDGAYVLKEKERVQFVVQSENYLECKWFYTAGNKDPEILDVTTTPASKPSATNKTLLEMKIQEAEEELALMKEGKEPGQFEEGTIAEIQSIIDEYKEIAQGTEVDKATPGDAEKKLRKAFDTAYDEKEVPETAKVTVFAHMEPNQPPKKMELELTNESGAGYGKDRVSGAKNRVTMVDAMVAAHRELYEDFDEANLYTDEKGHTAHKYFSEGLNGMLSPVGKLFGKDGMEYGLTYRINGTGYSARNMDVRKLPLKDGDRVDLYVYYKTNPGNAYVFFEEPEKTVKAGERFTMKLKGMLYSANSSTYDDSALSNTFGPMPDITVTLKNTETGEIVKCVEASDDNGKLLFKIGKTGVYELDSIESESVPYVFYPACKVTVKESANDPQGKPAGGKVQKIGIKAAYFRGFHDKVYNGKKQTQNIVGVYKDKKITYKASYSNNLNIGTATVRIQGTGAYNGVITKTFRILPGKASIKKIKRKRKAVKVKVGKPKGGVFCQVAYRKGNGTWKVITAKKKTVRIKKLKKKSMVEVRVRSCKKVSGKLYTSGWSTVKKVKVK
ncbi:hypothetical protein [Eubacterium sp. AB3007]|uniref:hypothetical protein n=1 Tax=Eubacterium sp. AB3007 TaxID=1392487 RepID=UPI00048801D8|nr:hypothetical protein [Eubacterium sp. AB3007]